MADITFVAHNSDSEDIDWSHITDLRLITVGGADWLISTTRCDGVLRSWSADTLDIIDTLAFDGGLVAGGSSDLAVLSLNGQDGLLIGGGTGGALQTVEVTAVGGFGSATALTSVSTALQGFQHASTFLLGSGNQLVVGTAPGAAGLTTLVFDGAGAYVSTSQTTDVAAQFLADVSATTIASVGGEDFLFNASGTDHGLSLWSIEMDGSLTFSDNLGNDDGLWIAAPTAMEVATVNGDSFVVLGSAGSGTLSVIQIDALGGLTIRDHVLDSRNTRFAGVTDLTVVEHQGRSYVIAGGADDGITVFLLMQGGHLLPIANIEDTVDMSLANISAIEARSRADGLDIFVASSSEIGVTQLRQDLGLTGQSLTATLAGGLLSGTSGNDILQGHDGDDLIEGGAGFDIIRDGDGSDTLTGGDGRDVFVLSSDDDIDTITDFTLGEDSLDLSLWSMLRDISQLTFSFTDTGMLIQYGAEILYVDSSHGGTIDYRQLSNADLISGTRIGSTIEPGYPGPATPTPDPDPDPPTDPSDQGEAADPLSMLSVLSGSSLGNLASSLGSAPPPAPPSLIEGTDGDDALEGTVGIDILVGGSGNDVLSGGDGADLLLGRDGDDTLFGQADADALHGGDGADTLDGGNGHDQLIGGNGDDLLLGGLGDDLLLGSAGADTFVFNGGTDVIGDFEQSIDRVRLDESLWTGLTSAADVLFFYGSFADGRATIDLGDGNILHIDDVTDYAALADHIDLF